MSINLKLETYESASDILNATKNILNDVMLTIDEVQNNLDYRINSYVKRDLTYTKNSIDNTNYSTTKLINNIISKKQSFSDIEKKITDKISEITTMSNEPTIKNIATSTVAGLMASTGAVVDTASSKLSEDSKSVFSKIVDSGKKIATTIKNTGAKVVEGAKSIVSKICDFGNEAVQAVTGGIKSIIEDPTGTLKKTAASIVNGAIALTQGLAKFGEALVDTGAIVATGVKSIFTGVYDGYQWLKGKITGDETWQSATKKMWAETQDFVKNTYVKDAYAEFYQNNAGAKWLDENAYSPFKSTGLGYQILDGVGYIGGVIALTFATGGAGATVAQFNLGSSALLTINSNALVSGGIAAVAGLGKNTEKAWTDGASIGEGLAYGTAMSIWEGAEMALGYSVNGLNIFNKYGTLRKGATITSHVAFDAADGAGAELITPIFQTIYNPNESNMEEIMYYVNYDENGNKINDKSWEELSFNEKYRALFNYNGGWKQVGIGAVSNASLSLLSEMPEFIANRNTITVAKEIPKIDGGKTQKVIVTNKRKRINSNQQGNGNSTHSTQTTIIQTVNPTIRTTQNNGRNNINVNTNRLANGGSNTLRYNTQNLTEVNNLVNDLVQNRRNSDAQNQIIEKMKSKNLTTGDLAKLIPFEKQVEADILFIGDNAKKILQKQKDKLPTSSLDNINKGFITTREIGYLLDRDSQYLYSLSRQIAMIIGGRESLYLKAELLDTLTLSKNGTLSFNNPVKRISANALGNMMQHMLDEGKITEANLTLKKIIKTGLTTEEKFSLITKDLERYCDYTKDDAYTRLYDSLIKEYKKSNNIDQQKYILHNIECLSFAKQNLGYVFELENRGAYINRGNRRYVLNSNVRSDATNFHEFGHVIHLELSKIPTPENWVKLLKKAQDNALKNADKLIPLQRSNYDNDYNVRQVAIERYRQLMIDKYGSREATYEAITKEISDINNLGVDEVLRKYNISEADIKNALGKIEKNELTQNKLAQLVYWKRKNYFVEECLRKGAGGAVSDMISAIFQREKVIINGIDIKLTFRHDDAYWARGAELSMEELMANYNSLKVQGRTDRINQLKEIFGSELFDLLENTFNQTY